MLEFLNRILDPMVLVLAAYLLKELGYVAPEEFAKVLAIHGAVLTVIIFPLFDLYRSWRGASLLMELKCLFFAWAAVLVSFNIIILLLATSEQFNLLWPFGIFSATQFWIWAVIVLVIFSAYRIVIRLVLRNLRSRGKNQRRVVIVGAGDLGRRVAETFSRNTWLGFQVLGFFDDDPGKLHKTHSGVPVLGSLDELPSFVNSRKVDIVFLAIPFRSEERIRSLNESLGNTIADVYMVPDVFSFHLLNLSMLEIAGLPVLNLNFSPFYGHKAVIKVVEDMLLAFLILILISPLLVVIAALVKLSSPGPVIFKQRRYGFMGEEIMVYKFRTMTVCEDGDVINQAKERDPRITKIGAFLRRTSLDELPQFINVLQGRMSIVGPRPHAVAHNEMYRRLIRSYMLRHKVKPGITGLAQINGCRGETDTLDKMERRVAFDLEYISRWSLWLDIKIVAKSILVGFSGENAR